MANLRTKARAIDLLGKNQIADLPTAIAELWKNGYDAYGDKLEADIYANGYDNYNHAIFTLSDDGHGMSKEDLENKWLVLGTDNKKKKGFNTPKEDMFEKEIRTPLGEKGIGRLSVAYLGDHFLMITKKVDKPFELLFINWKVLENSDLYIENITIPMVSLNNLDTLEMDYKKLLNEFSFNISQNSWSNYLEEKKLMEKDLKDFENFPNYLKEKLIKSYKETGHGTFFIIFNPIDEIINFGTRRSISSKDNKGINNNTNYIRHALTGLFNVYNQELMEKKHKIWGENNYYPAMYYHENKENVKSLFKYDEFFTLDDFINSEHRIIGTFNEKGIFKGDIKVFDNLHKNYIIAPEILKMKNYGTIDIHIAFCEVTKENSKLSDEMYRYYEKKLEDYAGLFVYRNNFRVLPYGREDFDWLEFETRRSRHAGRYYFAHRKIFGYINISKEKNPKLIDKAGREGFINNSAYKELKEDLVNFFIKLADEFYGTKSQYRQGHLQEVRNKKSSELKIKEEEKRNIKELIEFRKKIKKNDEELEKLNFQIEELYNEIHKKEQIKIFKVKETKEILTKIDFLKSNIQNKRVNPSVRLTITDSDKDKLYVAEMQIREFEERLKIISDEVLKNTEVNELVNYYKERFSKVKSEMEKQKTESEKSLSNSFVRLNEKLILYNKQYEIDLYAPSYINIENLSTEETQKKLNELEAFRNIFFDKQKIEISGLLEYLSKVDFDRNDEEILGAYKEKMKELRKKVEALHELAQLGMAIEIIDHQFNVLYSQIADGLRFMSKRLEKATEEEKESFNRLRTSFAHLESNHKLMVPLYRTMKRSKRDIKGYEIEKIVLGFFEKIFKEEKIEFKVTHTFKEFGYYTFESVINPVFINVINNAVYWLRNKNEKIIEIDVNDKKEVLIMNSGEPMTFTDLTNCFELFFSKRPGGRGIGLYLAKMNLRTVGMDIYSTDDKNYNRLNGACFVVSEYKGEE